MHQLLEMMCDIALILYLICITVLLLLFYINVCVNLLNMFTKHEFKLEVLVAVSCCYAK